MPDRRTQALRRFEVVVAVSDALTLEVLVISLTNLLAPEEVELRSVALVGSRTYDRLAVPRPRLLRGHFLSWFDQYRSMGAGWVEERRGFRRRAGELVVGLCRVGPC